MATSKEVKEILTNLKSNGCEVRRGKSNHYKVYQNGIYKMTIGSTSSDYRALQKIKTQIKHFIFGGIKYDDKCKLSNTW